MGKSNAPIRRTQHDPNECCACHEPVGEAVDEYPMNVADDDGNGSGRTETFCAACFVYVRAPKEPLRWHPGTHLAIRCAGCGKSSVAFGHRRCPQCKSGAVIELPPKGVILGA